MISESNAFVADAHNDLLCAVVARPVERWGTYFRERWLPQLREGGVAIQVLPVFVDRIYRPENSLRQTLRMIEAAHRVAAESPDEVALCVDGAQIDAALDSGRIALLLALEGSQGIGADVELFDIMHLLGVRMASLTHFGRTLLADGSGEDAAGSRLTATGVAALRRMEQVGVLFDISHLGVGGVEHVLDLAARPVIASHSGARAVFDHHRNLTDHQLRGVADTGGMVCVNFFGPYLGAGAPTLDMALDHLEHVVSVIGITNVGLGPDFVKEAYRDAVPPGCEDGLAGPDADRLLVPGLEGPSGLPLVHQGLRDRGWTVADIRAVLGENVRMFLSDHLLPA